MNKIFNLMHSKVFGEVFKNCCENLSRWTWKPKVKNFVHLILKTRDYEDSASIFRLFVSHHKKKGRTFKKITPKFGRIMQNWVLKPLCVSCILFYWFFGCMKRASPWNNYHPMRIISHIQLTMILVTAKTHNINSQISDKYRQLYKQ